MLIVPATIIHPFHPWLQLPWMSTVMRSLLGGLDVSGLPEGVSTKMRPFGGGSVHVWLPW